MDNRLNRHGEITERDRAVLAWIVRHSATTVTLVARFHFSGSEAMAARRLRVMRSWGLLRTVPVGHRMVVYIATSRGAAMAGLGLRPPRVSGLVAEIDHTLLLTAVTEALAARLGATIVTERELRAQLLRRRRLDEWVPPGRVPDALLIRGGAIALEVDRTPKRSAQLRLVLAQLLPRLGTSAEWRRLIWVAPTPAVADRYRRVVGELSASDVVTVVALQEVLP